MLFKFTQIMLKLVMAYWLTNNELELPLYIIHMAI